MGREYFIFTMQSLRLLVSDKLESVLKYISWYYRGTILAFLLKNYKLYTKT
jgi:hypothetical protein